MSLLLQYAKDLNLVVSDEDIARKIIDLPYFKDEKGQFQKQLFKTMLQHEGLTEKNFF